MREEGWITKAEAAALLDVDERTVERKARAGKIASKQRPGFPTLYLQAAVEILRQAGSGEVRTGILEPVPPANGNGLTYPNLVGGRDLDKLTGSDDPIRQLAAAFRAFLLAPTGPTDGPTGPTSENPFLTLAEAAAARRVSERLLLRWIRTGKLDAEREPRSQWSAADRGWRIRRKDLEAF